MKLEIKSITFSNIMSFGSVPTTIKFDQGVTLWRGSNGQGKSSALLDSLSYCLYGKPYRKIKIEELINRKNKSGLKTTCEFNIGEDNYILTRGKSPDKLELLKNGNEVDLLSSKKLTQVEIDKIIGCSYEIFKQTISIAVSYNKPFLASDSISKRKIIEKMFALEQFSSMSKVLQEKNKTSKKALDILENNIQNIESTIRLFNKQIISLEEQNRNFERLNQEKIDKHKMNLSREQSLLQDKLQEEIPFKEDVVKLKEKIIALDKQKYVTAKKKFDTQKNEYDWTIRNISTQITKLQTQTDCPTCKRPFDVDKRTEEINKNTEQKKELEIKSSDLNIKIQQLSENIEIIEDKEKKLVLAESKLQSCQMEIRDKQRNIKSYQDQIVELQSAKNEIDVDKVRNQVLEKEIELVDSKALKEIEEVNVKNFSIVDKILSDEGVRSYIIEKIYPLLNRRISDYLELFEIPIRLVFDRNMEEKIISLEHFRSEISYMSMSEGEKKRIDTAIMLSLIDVMKIISNWDSNLLVVDELLDGATDINGLEQMLLAMKRISKEKNVNVNIISHRLNENFSEMFDKKIKVLKNVHGFSEIKEE